MSELAEAAAALEGAFSEPRLSPATAGFLLSLLDRIQLSAGDPDFDAQVAAIQRARAELAPHFT